MNTVNQTYGLIFIGVGGGWVGGGLSFGGGIGIGQFVDMTVGDPCTQSHDGNSFGHWASAMQP